MPEEVIYQIEAHNKSPLDAAQEFARDYWDKPRSIENAWPENGDLCFQVEDGIHTYRVIYKERVAFVSPALWQIVVEE